KWYTQLAEDTTQRNASGVYRTVASMFRYAARTAQGVPDDFDRWIDESPSKVPGGSANRRSKPRDQVLSTPEQTRQMAESMPEGDSLMVLLGGYAGLRIVGVLALLREEIIEYKNDDSL